MPHAAQDQVRSPIHEYRGKWYFYDETWASRIGPYDKREQADEAFKTYAQSLNGSHRTYWNYA